MASLNNCNFIGNLGADPEIRNLPSGGKVVNFSIAVTEKWRDKNSGENREKTEWVRIVVFSEGLVGVVEKYLKKGMQVFVSGKMQTRKWQDQSGQDKYSTEIVLNGFDAKILMLGQRQDGGGSIQNNSGSDNSNGSNSATSSRPQGGGYSAPGGMDDDIPFAPIF